MNTSDAAAEILTTERSRFSAGRLAVPRMSSRGRGWRRVGLAALGWWTLILAGCALPEAQPDLSRFYVLTPMAGETNQAAAESGSRVWVKQVIVPEFLRGKVMQVRVTENEVRFVDTARWAEALEAGLTRVLRENLARQSGAVRVVDRASEEHDYEVVIQLKHCEGVLSTREARLAARVEIISTGLDPKQVAADEFAIAVGGWDGLDYGQLAAKLSEGAAALSARIAALVPAEKS